MWLVRTLLYDHFDAKKQMNYVAFILLQLLSLPRLLENEAIFTQLYQKNL